MTMDRGGPRKSVGTGLSSPLRVMRCRKFLKGYSKHKVSLHFYEPLDVVNSGLLLHGLLHRLEISKTGFCPQASEFISVVVLQGHEVEVRPTQHGKLLLSVSFPSFWAKFVVTAKTRS